jgi:putative endonuclease
MDCHAAPVSTRSHPNRCSPAARSEPTAVRDRRRALGRLGEELAAAHLRGRGFRLLARNARTRRGEIDLIAFDGWSLVFCEVKCRCVRTALRPSDLRGQPLQGLGARQRMRLRRLAAAWLADQTRARPTAQLIRFDAIGVTVDRAGRVLRLEHIESAW